MIRKVIGKGGDEKAKISCKVNDKKKIFVQRRTHRNVMHLQKISCTSNRRKENDGN